MITTNTSCFSSLVPIAPFSQKCSFSSWRILNAIVYGVHAEKDRSSTTSTYLKATRNDSGASDDGVLALMKPQLQLSPCLLSGYGRPLGSHKHGVRVTDQVRVQDAAGKGGIDLLRRPMPQRHRKPFLPVVEQARSCGGVSVCGLRVELSMRGSSSRQGGRASAISACLRQAQARSLREQGFIRRLL